MVIDGGGEAVKAYLDEECFDLESMRKKNRESIYLDGIRDVADGVLYYTDELVKKCHEAFGVSLMREVRFEDIDKAAQFLITEVIEKNI